MTVYTQMIQRSALKFAAKGVPVFPLHSLDNAGVCTCGGPQVNPKCSPAKHPRTPNGFKDASTDPRKITAWWTRWPDANIGLPTGEASGFFSLDIDLYKGVTREQIESKFGPLPPTTTVKTGRSGLQLYYRNPEGETLKGIPEAKRLGPGVCVKATGGYVVAPPSRTEGPYEYLERCPLADPPDWLLEALRDKPRKPSGPGRSQSQASILDDGEPIHEGGRDETLTRIAGRRHDGTRDEGQLEADLQAINESRCIPPLPPEQVRKIARSIYRYEPCRPARREPDAETVEALAKIEAAILRREYRGQGGKTEYSIAVAALKLARQHGDIVDDGVRVEVSTRQLALAAAVSRRTIVNKLKNMGEILRHDTDGAESGKSGAIVLLLPRATFHHSNHRVCHKGGCAKLRAPLTAPRLRWSSPPRRPRRGVTPGTSRVRQGVSPEKVAAVVRLGKSCEMVMDVLEVQPGGSMTLSALAAALNVRRPRDLTRRKNLETGRGRDGYVTRLEAVGVLMVDGDTVSLVKDWLGRLDEERERTGEIALFKRDMRRYNDESKAYRNRDKVKADPAPSEDEMRAHRESYPARRREAIEAAIEALFREQPEYRGRRAGQIACQLVLHLSDDFPRGGPDGVPKDHEVAAILAGVAA